MYHNLWTSFSLVKNILSLDDSDPIITKRLSLLLLVGLCSHINGAGWLAERRISSQAVAVTFIYSWVGINLR